MAMTLRPPQGIKGNQFGSVDLRFSTEALVEFIGLLNVSKIRNHDGYVISFEVVEFTPGEAILEVTLTKPESIHA